MARYLIVMDGGMQATREQFMADARRLMESADPMHGGLTMRQVGCAVLCEPPVKGVIDDDAVERIVSSGF
jgi:hypothetical protein